jgi:hypothetical protein
MSNQEQWEALFRTWFGRLIIDPDWQMTALADEHIDASANYSVIRPHRQVVFRFRPQHQASSLIACHEVCHLFLSQMQHAGDAIADQLPAPAQALARKWMEDAMEHAADDLARAFMRAYGEHDG